ncbi:unnamed protein product [Thlaspi arvense]|uniref:DUF4283 domain-containing protein n=1 Tax=Thlaspi arvense TaxID=13288 RepID=A0AAU9S9Y1_THLAR|nr:unnamed protein product [Thlaspi arvense]
MSQSGQLGSATGSNKGKAMLLLRLKITVPRFDNSDLIKGYSGTLIGRCMNPMMQDMNALLIMFPRIWKVEDCVAGADLGMGRFQFDFDEEEDINSVLQMEPYHFDGWMVVLVQWEPIMEPNYPSSLTFWVRIMGVPLHFWADTSFRNTGEAIRAVHEIDLDGGRVRLTLDAFKPVILASSVTASVTMQAAVQCFI